MTASWRIYFLLTNQASAAVYIRSLRVSEKSPLYLVMPGIRFRAHVILTIATHFVITSGVQNACKKFCQFVLEMF